MNILGFAVLLIALALCLLGILWLLMKLSPRGKARPPETFYPVTETAPVDEAAVARQKADAEQQAKTTTAVAAWWWLNHERESKESRDSENKSS
jgi:hypothetical protein